MYRRASLVLSFRWGSGGSLSFPDGSFRRFFCDGSLRRRGNARGREVSEKEACGLSGLGARGRKGRMLRGRPAAVPAGSGDEGFPVMETDAEFRSLAVSADGSLCRSARIVCRWMFGQNGSPDGIVGMDSFHESSGRFQVAEQ